MSILKSDIRYNLLFFCEKLLNIITVGDNIKIWGWYVMFKKLTSEEKKKVLDFIKFTKHRREDN